MFPSSSSTTSSTPFALFDTNHQQQTLHPPPSSFSFLHHLPPLPILDEPCFQDQDHQEIDNIFLPHHHHHHHHDLFFLHQDQSQEGNYINKSTTTDEDDQIPLLFQGITSTTANNDNNGSSRKMRSCKRDRHSKIKTAKGLRDRRMRLSLEVAKRFFGLQDMLGFDKASKTVEWLLNHSKNEIKKLAKAKHNHDDDEIRLVKSGTNTISTTTSTPLSSTNSAECEGLSCLDDEVAFISSGIQVVKRKSSSSRGSNNNKGGISSRKKRRSGSSSVLHHPVIGKESRKKARERARERTKEKEKMKMKMMKISTTKNLLLEASITTTNTTTTNHCHQFNDNCNHITQFGSWNPFESTARSQESSGGGKLVNNNNSNNNNNNNNANDDDDGDDPSLELDVMPEADHQQEQQKQQQQRRGSQPKDDESFVINMTKWSPSNIFTSFNNSPFSQEHQFAEFQPLAKFWEAHNINHMI